MAYGFKLIPVIGNAAARAPHGERGSDNAGETNVLQHFKGSLQGVSQRCPGGFQANALHGLVEQFPVLSLVDGILGSANHLDAVLVEDTLGGQFECAIQGGLAAHGRQNCIRPLAINDSGNRLPLYGFDVSGIGHRRIGHDRGRIGVDQNDAVPLLAQGLTSLGAGIVELAGLANNNWPGAEDKNTFDIATLGHVRHPRPGPAGRALPV